MGYNIAVAGATGAVGECMLEILEQREFPVDQLHLLASSRSAGKRIMFRDKSHTVTDLADFDFAGTDIALFSAGGETSACHAPRAAASGCVVIDNTSHFRRRDDIPLVVAEVNPHRIADHRATNIIANPNCSTMQMLVALKPLHDHAGIRRINVATYQAVSGAGRAGIDQLAGQTARLLNGQPIDIDSSVFARQIAFSALPHIGAFEDNGYTNEEMKMVWETRKILEDDSIRVNPTCVRIPVFYGHSEAVHIETRDPLDAATARDLLRAAPGVTVIDDRTPCGYPTPADHAAGTDDVFVGRIREDLSDPRGLNLWIVSDNVRKGAALNSVQIAELLIADRYIADR